MIKVLYKQIYIVKEEGAFDWILVLYNISANHYVGLPLNKEKKNDNDVYIKSIKRYADIKDIKDYNKYHVQNSVYINGKPLKITDDEYNKILSISYNEIISYLSDLNINVDNLSYMKWCKDKYILNNSIQDAKLIQRGIYWVNFGVNVGSEIRKLRPAIL